MTIQPETSQIVFRNYDPDTDRDAVHRIWLEIGWLEKGQEESMDALVECGRALVAEVNGVAECLATSAPGSIRYLEEELPFTAITAVTTSRIARKQGLAGRLTAMTVAADAADGALVTSLGIFEQGFYDQLGFGSGNYEHWITFDPALLQIDGKARTPRRITADEGEMVHASRLTRLRGHGACNLYPAAISTSEMAQEKKNFGLGYCDGPNGELTHHLWCHVDNAEDGPYRILWLTYQNREQFLELMALIESLGDQVRLVKMREPQGIQLQDLIQQPFKHRQLTAKSKFEQTMRATAYWQMRICDLPGCLARTRLRGEKAQFNLKLSDPIERFLETDATWRGVGGDYVVTLGSESAAELGVNQALPTLAASVGAFTRLWLGVRPATGLAVTDTLSGPRDLLEQLDQTLCLPSPKPDWDF